MSGLVSVLTTINYPTHQVKHLAELTRGLGGRTVVVGDRKTPSDWSSPHTEFFSYEAQVNHDRFKSFAKILPFNHYARKNLGYLLAMLSGPEWIFETDDDNFVQSSSFCFPPLTNEDTDSVVRKAGWVNIFCFFERLGEECSCLPIIWPRGYPLELIKETKVNPRANENSKVKLYTPIASGIVNGDPDVDAIYRLTRELPINFELLQTQLVLFDGSWCPFNSQNTWWHRSVFPLLYLPITTTFRVTDIMRSYVAIAILERFSKGIRFFGPSAIQERNEHNLISDFEQEVPLYLSAQSILESLRSAVAESIDESNALLLAYSKLCELGYVGRVELDSIELWLKAIKSL